MMLEWCGVPLRSSRSSTSDGLGMHCLGEGAAGSTENCLMQRINIDVLGRLGGVKEQSALNEAVEVLHELLAASLSSLEQVDPRPAQPLPKTHISRSQYKDAEIQEIEGLIWGICER